MENPKTRRLKMSEERQEIFEEIKEIPFPLDNIELLLEYLIEKLQNINKKGKELGYRDIRLWHDYDYRDRLDRIYICGYRKETDKELAKRLEEEKERIEKAKVAKKKKKERAEKRRKKEEEKKRALYEELKKEFEGK
jgi:CBS domain containing-hemolysin-like protein